MADQLQTSNYFSNLGGINQKASKYDMTTAQFLDIRNMDFDIPKALQKRPGSTFGIGSSNGTSGPIQSLFEFSKLTGESYIIAASDTALFYVAANAFTLLKSSWNNGQPVDMNTFVNKLWMANGQSYASWNGSSYFSAGLPTPPTVLGINAQSVAIGASWMLVAGATMVMAGGGGLNASFTARGVFIAYSYLRSDGYVGPANFLQDAKNVVRIVDSSYITSGQEYFNTFTTLAGFTVPPNNGITAISIWIATDTVDGSNAFDFTVEDKSGSVRSGNLGYQLFGGTPTISYMGITLKPGADLSRFSLFTTMPTSQLVAKSVLNMYSGGNQTMWTVPFISAITFASYAVVATSPRDFGGQPYAFFATYTPKYIEQHKNMMFYAGSSSAPSVLWFSEIGAPETVLPDSTFEVRTNDGDRVYGIASFNNSLLVMKEHSFHKLIGDDADNFQLIQLSTDFGCLSQQTILTVNQSAYWLDKKGILEFNGASWNVISGPIENIFRRMNVSAAKEKAVGVHHIYRNQIWFGIPVDGSTINNLTVVYDYLVQGWTFFDGYNATSYAYIKGALSRPTVWRGDQSGMIHYTGESFYSDSGNGITCLPFTRFENDGGQNQTTIWRRFFLDVASVAGASTPIQAKVFSNYDQSTVQATFQMFQSQFQSRAEMGVVGKAVAIQLSHYSASLPLLINGYGLAKRGLRNV